MYAIAIAAAITAGLPQPKRATGEPARLPPAAPPAGAPAVESETAGVATATAPAEPTQDTLRIDWNAPPGCPDGIELRRRIDEQMGAAVRAEQDALTVTGEISGAESTWNLRLRIANDAGEQVRELPGTSCDELTGTAALLVAIALERDAAPKIDGPPPPTKTADPPQPQPPPPPQRHRFGGALGVQAGLSWGPLPRLAGGLGASGALLLRHARIEIGGAYWFPRISTPASRTDEASVQLWYLHAGGCGVPAWKRVELVLCAGMQAGAMSGHGRGANRPRTGRLPWVAVAMNPGVVLKPIPRLGLRLDTTLVVPVVRPGFSIDDLVVFRARPAGFVAALGVEVRLP